ncbi:MAG: phosphatidylserine decarboxylase family protein [Desulfobacterales bacterium]|nr:phosphatidylserine decarboxylase family protein [Desulfobacterales bacterium]MDD4072044.1 phosphatidylserine decarboxylase family protein [Desulfobacterales bacterium]MDD4394008.1 phosphatidylserine decarboxylase family protein [Desulfobacterales bacterium]
MKEFSYPEPSASYAFPVAKAGFPIIFSFAFITLIFAILDFTAMAVISLIITLGICLFFRDPDRVVPNDYGAVVSPADGKIIYIDTVDNSPYYPGHCMKISIFMSVLNVHVNRVPHEGTVKQISYYPGKFFSANLDKASRENEHNAVLVETAGGRDICFVQIAGLIARRIICRIQKGDTLKRGQRFGMICFGSRLDVYLPVDIQLNVSVGNKVRAGHSILGYFK